MIPSHATLSDGWPQHSGSRTVHSIGEGCLARPAELRIASLSELVENGSAGRKESSFPAGVSLSARFL